MNKDWLNSIYFKNSSEKKQLEQWCENIGYERYEQIFSIVGSNSSKKVEFSILMAVAKYNFVLSDMLYSMIKFVELRFRGFLINEYGDLTLTRKEYLYQLSEGLGNGQYLDCSTYYDNKLPDKTNLKTYLSASSLETVLRVLFLLADEKLKRFDANPAILKMNLLEIKKIRNSVAHGDVLLGDKYDLKKIFISLLKYLPTKETKEKRVKELEELNNRLFDSNQNSIGDLIKNIVIILQEADLKEIGL